MNELLIKVCPAYAAMVLSIEAEERFGIDLKKGVFNFDYDGYLSSQLADDAFIQYVKLPRFAEKYPELLTISSKELVQIDNCYDFGDADMVHLRERFSITELKTIKDKIATARHRINDWRKCELVNTMFKLEREYRKAVAATFTPDMSRSGMPANIEINRVAYTVEILSEFEERAEVKILRHAGFTRRSDYGKGFVGSKRESCATSMSNFCNRIDIPHYQLKIAKSELRGMIIVVDKTHLTF